jgi:hypothetical protein
MTLWALYGAIKGDMTADADTFWLLSRYLASHRSWKRLLERIVLVVSSKPDINE